MRVTTLRCDQDQLFAIAQIDQGAGARLARFAPERREQHDRRAADVVAAHHAAALLVDPRVKAAERLGKHLQGALLYLRHGLAHADPSVTHASYVAGVRRRRRCCMFAGFDPRNSSGSVRGDPTPINHRRSASPRCHTASLRCYLAGSAAHSGRSTYSAAYASRIKAGEYLRSSLRTVKCPRAISW